MLKAERTWLPTEIGLQPPLCGWPRAVFAQDNGSGAGVAIGGRPRVLIVEDDYLVAGGLETELSAAGFDVVGTAPTANEAIRLATREKPLFVIMDIRLEGARDGVEAAIEIYRSCGIRSLFASAHNDDETRRRAEPAAPLGWIAKPYTMRSLLEAVEAAVRALRHMDEI